MQSTFFTLLVLTALCCAIAQAQLSKSVASDKQLEELQRESALANKKVVGKQDVSFGQDATPMFGHSRCKHSDLDMRWQQDVGSSVYQAPAVFDLFADGKKELIIPTFVRYLEVLQGTSGAEAQSLVTTKHNEDDLHDSNTENHNQHHHNVQQWPFSHRLFATHASPVMYDIDLDGQMEIVQALASGEIAFFKQTGEILKKYSMKVLPLGVRKDWYAGMDDSKMDISMNLNNEQVQTQQQKAAEAKTEQEPIVAEPEGQVVSDDEEVVSEEEKPIIKSKKTNKKAKRRRKLLQVNDSPKPAARKPRKKNAMRADVQGWFSKEAAASMNLITYLPQSLRAFSESEGPENPFAPSNYEEALKALKDADPEKKLVFVDAHLLSAPVIADIDKDGKDELIVAVSYYFDREHYARPEVLAQVDPSIDLSKYVAGGIVVFDLATRQQKWVAHMDLTTEKTKLKAYIYASPTLADIDSDGSVEIIVGTALGFIYAFDKSGTVKSGFPVLMGQIQGQVIAEDVNSDGDLELCAVDFRSNLACFDYHGKIVWQRQLSGYCSQPPVVADINNDGILEIVVGTSTGHIWAVRGTDGVTIKHFPVKTGGPIYAPALIAELNTTLASSGVFATLINRGVVDPSKGLSVVVPSFDGFVYIIDGYSGCIDKIDIGEKAYAQILMDDISGNDKMDLIIATMNGNIYSFGTAQPYHPMKASSHQVQSWNGFAYRHNYHGIFVQKTSRHFRDVIGNNFKVHFEIVDKRKMPDHIPRSYTVRISIGKQVVLLNKVYKKAGKHVETVSAPSERMFGTVVVEMFNEHGQMYYDTFSVSFNMGFINVIKWAIVVPFVLSAGLLLYIFSGAQQLPS